jgi:hypothetical protein
MIYARFSALKRQSDGIVSKKHCATRKENCAQSVWLSDSESQPQERHCFPLSDETAEEWGIQ